MAEALEPRHLLAAQIVYDLNTLPNNNAGLYAMATTGPVAYFAGNEGTAGLELWKTDGTPAGTSLVKDIIPGPAGGTPVGFTRAGGFTYFAARTDDTGWELWKTDGTPTGTSLVKDINPGPANSNPGTITAAGSVVYFLADDGIHGIELWRSDGTDAGTFLVKDVRPGTAGQTRSSPTLLGRADGTVFFQANNGTAAGNGMWKSDGTADNASLVFAPQYNSGVYNLTASGSRVYFTDSSGYLYASDGTTANTKIVDQTNNTVTQVLDVGGTLYYNRSGGVRGIGPTDSSYFTVYASSSYSTTPSSLANVNGTLYFAATMSSGSSSVILKVPAGSSLASAVNTWSTYPAPSLANLTAVGTTLFFTTYDSTSGTVLWKSGGTPATTTSLKTLYAGSPSSSYAPNSFMAVGGKLVFINGDATNTGPAVWASDGTTAGTGLVRDVYPGTDGSGAYPIGSVNNILLLRADATGSSSGELWFTDGIPGHTMLMADIYPGVGGSNPGNAFTWNGLAYFTADDGTRGRELWVTDGTPAGTSLLKDLNPGAGDSYAGNFTPFNGRLFFTATDAAHGTELWVTDGTPAGTSLVSDLYPGTSDGIFGAPVVFNGALYFIGDNGSTGPELWTSDGTPAGATVIKDIYPGSSSSSPPTNLTVSNGRLYVRATDGTRGAEPWVSDGTPGGTTLLKDIYAGTSNSSPANFTTFGSLTYFTATVAAYGTELWVTDGTPAGTTLVADINLGTGSGSPKQLAVANGRLLFLATAADANDYLYSIASPGQTPVPVSPGGLAYNSTRVYNDRYFFSLDDDIHGAEAWVSDGTPTGTYLLQDLRPGWIGDTYGPFFPFRGTIYFQGDDGLSFWELYRLIPPTAATSAATYSVSPGNTIQLSAAGSSDPDNLPLTYAWDLDGDGIFGETGPDAARGDETGPAPTFSAAGLPLNSAYTIRLRVTNPTNLTGESSAAIIVGTPPSATFASGGPVPESTPGSVSFANPVGTGPFTYSYDFDNDGTFEVVNSASPTAVVPATYLPDGPATQTVRGRITDAATGLFWDYTTPISVTNSAPTALFPNTSGAAGQPIAVAVTNATDPSFADSARLTYSFDLDNDGTWDVIDSPYPTATTSYVAGGTYSVRARVKDKDGAFTVYTASVSVTAPTRSVSGTVFNDATGDGIYNTATGDYPLNLVKIYVDLNNNGSLDGIEPYVTSDMTGAYRIYLADGSYTLRAVFPAGYNQTFPASGVQTVTINGLSVINANFGGMTTGNVNFGVFNDVNGDGVMGSGDFLQYGQTIYVDSNNNGSLDAGEMSATTDNGAIASFDLYPGTYTVRLLVPNGWTQTTPAAGAAFTVNVTSGAHFLLQRFGMWEGPVANIGGPYTVNEGGVTIFGGGGTTVSGRTITAVEWDLDYDGSSFQIDGTGNISGLNAANIDGPTTRTIAVRVRDSAGFVSPIVTTTLSVLNVAPTAAFPTTVSATVGSYVFLELSSPFDPSPADTAAGFKYSYDLDGDGTFEYADVSTTGMARIYSAPGTYTVRARIKDKDGGSTTYTATVTIVQKFNATGVVFQDANADGIQNGQDQFISGANIYADLNNNGKLDFDEPVALSNSSGAYSLPLEPGTYTLRANFDTSLYLPTAVTPITITITNRDLVAGNFGAAAKGSASFFFFNDANRNGLADSGEALLSGRTVYADLNNNGSLDPGEPSATSNSISATLSLFPGTYNFRQVLPATWEQTSPANNQPVTITISGGVTSFAGTFTSCALPVATVIPKTVSEGSTVVMTWSAFLGTGRSITAYEWDVDYDGSSFQIDATGSTPTFSAASIDGPATRTVALRIRDSAGAVSPIATALFTITNVAPFATFGNPTSPNFTGTTAAPTPISFTNPADAPADLAAGLLYSFDLDNDGTFETLDSTSPTASRLFPATGTYTVSARVKDKDGAFTTYSATVLITIPTYIVSGTSFHDANANGLLDAGEAGFSSLQIFADLNNNGTKDAGEPSATPAASGTYSLSLTPGTYTIRANIDTASYLPTYPAAGSYTLTVTDQNLAGYDFGTARKGTASFSLFRDDNADGLLSAGEAGISGRTIFADLNNNGIKDTGEPSTTTDSAGNAALSLFPGTYNFRQVLPANWAQTLPAAAQPISLTLTGNVTSTAKFGSRALPTAAITTSAPTVAEGLSIPISASGTPVSGRSITTYEWDLNYDGSTFDVDATGATATFSAASIDGPATRSVAVRVRDSVGAVSNPVTATVTIINRAPTASLGNSGPVNEGAAGATVTLYNPSDVPADIGSLTYSYDFDNDGTFEITNSTTLTATVPASYLNDGPFTRTVRARVTDKDGGYTDLYTAITVYDLAPTLSVTPTPNNGVYTLTLSASDPGQDPITSWTVDWGDGTKLTYPGAAPTPSHTYTSTGTRTILVTATNKDGTFGASAAPLALDTSFSGDGKDTSIWGTTDRFNDLAAVWPAHLVTVGVSSQFGATVSSRRFDNSYDNFISGGYVFTAFTNVAVQADGKVVILGTSTNSTTGAVDAIALRFTASGNTDYSFFPGSWYPIVDFGSPNDTISALAVASDGSVFIGGAAGAAGTSPKFAVAKLTPTGVLDTTFGTGGIALYTLPGSTSACVNALSILPDGRILAALTGPTSAPLALARLNSDGSLDTTFTGGTSATPGLAQYALASGVAAAGARRLTLLPDGRFLVATYGGSSAAVARFQPNGALDTTFGSATTGSVTLTATATVAGVSLAVGPAGRISVVFNDGSLTRVTNLTAAGLPDPVLGSATYALTGSSDRPAAAAGLPDGRLLLAVNPTTTSVSALVALFAPGVVPVSKTISVTPSATFSNSGPVNESATATATVTFSNPTGTAPFAYSFDFNNDGTFEIINSSNRIATVPSSYLNDGPTVRTILGRIRDASGLVSDFTTQITVNNLPPTAAIANVTVPFASPTATLTFTSPTDPSPADVAAGLKYSFDFDNDGTFDVTNSSSPTTTYTFPAPGLYTVRARVADKDGGFTDYLPTVRVLPAFPAATLSVPDTAEGTSATVSLSAIVAAAPYTISFDLNNDGVFEITNSASPTATIPASLLPDGPATKTVRARVTDSFGQSSIFTTTFNITNTPPTATFTPPAATEGVPVTLTLVSPFDAATDTAAGFRYAFDLDNDGTFEILDSTTPSATTTFPDNGTYTVRARITDKDGGSTTYTAQVVVANQSPTATLSATPAFEGATTTISLTNPSDTPADLAAGLLYSFDLDNDGAFEILDSASPSTSATFADNGPRTVRARITDKDGGSTVYTLVVNVANVAPTATLSGSSVSENTPGLVSFSSPADVPDDTAAGFTYSYDFDNDGTFEIVNSTTPSATVPASYLPDGPATHTVRARISDKDGGHTDYTTTIKITNTPPTASFLPPAAVPEGASGSVTLVPADPSPTDKAAGFRYSFDFNNDGTFEIVDSPNPTAIIPASYFPDGPATLTVRGRVTDKDGAVSPDTTATITVTNVAPDLITPAGANIHVPIGSSYLLSLAADDPGRDTISSWFVRWGDGQTSTTHSPTALLPHQYAAVGRYTITVTATDDDGSYDLVTSIAVTDSPPAATLTSGALTPDRNALRIVVTYTGDYPIDAATVGDGDLTVTGPAGSPRAIRLVSAEPSSDGRTLVATYDAAAPYFEGPWSWQDSGAYTISLRPAAVSDTHQNFAPASTLGAAAVQLAIPDGPDLVPSFVVPPPTSLVNGNLNTVVVRIANAGNLSLAPTKVTTRLYLSTDPFVDPTDKILAKASWKLSLKTKASQLSTLTFRTPAVPTTGNYYVLAKTDVTGVVAERNERNNTSARRVKATTPFPDLAASLAQPLKSAYTAGSPLPLSLKLANVGSTPYAGNVAISILFSADPIADASDTPLLSTKVKAAINPKGTQTFNLSANISDALASHSGYLIIRTTPTAADHNPANNTVATPFNIT